MALKNILVSYNGSPQAQSALNTALVLAERYDAHLTGVLVHGLPYMLYSYGGHVPQSAMDQLLEADREHRAQSKIAFMESASGLPAERVHFLDIEAEANEGLMQAALGYDLVVMGADEKHPDFPHMEAQADVIARNSGKPVMRVPLGYNAAQFNERVLLAWDGKRAASRAMGDAIKLLDPSAEVSVLSIGKEAKASALAAPARTHLERHGFKVEVLTRNTKKIGKAILKTAKEENIGMVVMGAYEHAKLAQDLFGGVTNTVLKKAEIPVLLSH